MRETMMYILDIISTLTQGSEVIRWVKTPHGCCRQAHIHMPTHVHTLVFWRRLHLDFHPSSTLSNISIWCDIFIFHHAVLVLQSRHSFQLFPAFFLSSAGVKQNYLLKEDDKNIHWIQQSITITSESCYVFRIVAFWAISEVIAQWTKEQEMEVSH